MTKARFSRATIKGIQTVVPSTEKSIDDEVESYGGDLRQISRIKKTIGIDRRRVVDAGTTSLDLGHKAADLLLEALDVEPDVLIFVTQTPDHFQPCNAAILHGRLELPKSCAAFDVNLGCSGYVYGLWLAHMMIECHSADNVLLVAADTLSKCVNPKDRAVAPLFGDAGSATLIAASTQAKSSWFDLHTDGSGFDSILIPAGGFREPVGLGSDDEETDEDGNTRTKRDLHMKGGEVFNFSIQEEPTAINQILADAGCDIDAIDYVVFHQANKYIIKNIAKRIGIDMDKVPHNTVSHFGNQSSCSIPATISHALQQTLANSEKQVILSGFGVGLSWATALLTVGHIYCPEIVDL